MIRHSFESPLPFEALAFLTRMTGIDFMSQDTSDWFCVTGYDEEGELLFVATFEPKTWFDWHFSIAVNDQHGVTRRVLRSAFTAVFSQAVRVTALVDPLNARALDQVKRMGFQYEGYLRMGVEGTRDAMMFGMLRDDCRFLPGYQGTGTITRTDFAGEPYGQLA